MLKKTISITLAALLAITTLVGCTQKTSKVSNSNKQVTIEYWEYFYEPKVKLIDKLIVEFEKENPNIKVVHKNFPYDSFQQKVATAIASKTGPDVVNLYYGWLPNYVKSKSLQALPYKDFPTATIEKEFTPMIATSKFNGKYYSLPTGVRTLGLYWNKDIFKANGLDPEKPPATLDELVEIAKKCTKRTNGKLEIEGLTYQPNAAIHTWFRPILLEQFGQKPLSSDNKKCLWNASENGYNAFEFLVDLARKDKVGEKNFFTDDATAFISGKAAMTIDGSYRLGAIKTKAPNLNYGTAALPTHNNVRKTFGSYWTNAITVNATNDKLDASIKFLKFLTSKDVMTQWTKSIGEIGARAEFANDAQTLSDEKLAPFAKQLPDAESYFYVDETADRDALTGAIDEVLLKNTDPRKALDGAVNKVQAMLDNYWNK